MVVAKRPGALYLGNGECSFTVWAPFTDRVEVRITEPEERLIALQRSERGYHQAMVKGIEPGYLYYYRLDGHRERPDPASRFQPQGVHGPSRVETGAFHWSDANWPGIELEEYVIYELHVGTYTEDGTFVSIIPHLDELVDLGITAIELMPVAQFPGNRNWGYDGVELFAVQNSYGGPEGLRRLVDACHRRKLAVVLDVVYNHLGPEGNYLGEFAPYFTDRYRTPWGPALNFDGPYSDEVRLFFIENALYWVTEFLIDALRLDAVHAILDHSPVTLLEDLADAVHEQAKKLNRHIHLFAESADNNGRLVIPRASGGYALDAIWNDDFHHSIHTLLTGENEGYYMDYGNINDVEKAFREGFVFTGEYSPYRQRKHGTPSRDIPAYRFVVCAQNHDQVGNRMNGERLATLVSYEALKLAAGLVILSPFVPLLFMGEEYGEEAPFLYFISHSEEKLVEAVRNGRREEFSSFQWQGEPPDPQDEATFRKSKLNHSICSDMNHGTLLRFYKELLRLRKELPPLRNLSKETLEVTACEQRSSLFLRRWTDDEQAFALFNFSDIETETELPLSRRKWWKILDSAEDKWNGPGSQIPDAISPVASIQIKLQPLSLALFVSAEES